MGSDLFDEFQIYYKLKIHKAKELSYVSVGETKLEGGDLLANGLLKGLKVCSRRPTFYSSIIKSWAAGMKAAFPVHLCYATVIAPCSEHVTLGNKIQHT